MVLRKTKKIKIVLINSRLMLFKIKIIIKMIEIIFKTFQIVINMSNYQMNTILKTFSKRFKIIKIIIKKLNIDNKRNKF